MTKVPKREDFSLSFDTRAISTSLQMENKFFTVLTIIFCSFKGGTGMSKLEIGPKNILD